MKKLYISALFGLAFYVTLEEECATFSVRGLDKREDVSSISVVTKRRYIANGNELVPYLPGLGDWPAYLLLKNGDGEYTALINIDYKDTV